jgi:hypothetical protein
VEKVEVVLDITMKVINHLRLKSSSVEAKAEIRNSESWTPLISTYTRAVSNLRTHVPDLGQTHA